MKISSMFCKILTFLIVTSPGHLIANPGPGNGCRFINVLGKFNSFPNFLTSSLKRFLKGSINFKPILLGNPPTL